MWTLQWTQPCGFRRLEKWMQISGLCWSLMGAAGRGWSRLWWRRSPATALSLPGWTSKNLMCVNPEGDVLAQFLWSALLLSTDVGQRKHTRSPKPFHYLHSYSALGSSLMKTSDETKNCQRLKQQHALKRCQSSMSLLVAICCAWFLMKHHQMKCMIFS